MQQSGSRSKKKKKKLFSIVELIIKNNLQTFKNRPTVSYYTEAHKIYIYFVK